MVDSVDQKEKKARERFLYFDNFCTENVVARERVFLVTLCRTI